MNIAMIFADSAMEWNCSQWRNLTPSDAINRTEGWFCKLIHVGSFVDYLNPTVQDFLGKADVITIQRNVISQEVIDAMEYWQAMGKPVAIDLDDAYHILPWSNPAHKFWLENQNIEPLQILEDGLRKSDGLIAPNRLLLSDWKHVARGYLIPNYAEKKWWMDLTEREEIKKKEGLNGKIVIGWGGSVSHYDSWHGSGIMKAAKRVAERHSNVVWMICGNDPRIVEHLPVHYTQKKHHLGVSPNEWPQVVKMFDIGVAPLFGPYDQRRSWIKGVEYLLAGVPWIGTAGEPYADLTQLGVLIPNIAEIWEQALEKKIVDLKQEQEIARLRIEIARSSFFADSHVETTYKKVYEQIRNDFTGEKGALQGVYYVNPQKPKE